MHWLWLFVVGLVVGIVAKFLMPGRDPGGFIITAILGIAGMFVGDWLAAKLGIMVGGGLGGFIAGVVGAIILLFLYRLVAKKA
ncbi:MULTISPECIES: GlsB/YeaQ/YmgE family stress response membrane protein [Oleiagrimonas]|uniref:GlsB/YeaQ/YmgE family stress response membrane protein n=1 Tax=Oleiagrimonas citrea TaxID=1665687 RepID=A0A846ZKD3_9GAMM|nr:MULTISPECIES: GlsB/YeaQ/YmgE family stress response membrane protein [Oleiagrimonas]NKZ38755.1 GlsB/YeaQ/YmgE family stress response membrane protein [Oleiagrimonas citrea]RAP59252.1 transglycosylase [Oleiagrimonas sp. MCCC 1A03011]